MISGVLVGYLVVVGIPLAFVALLVEVAFLGPRRRRRRAERFGQMRDKMAAMVNAPISLAEAQAGIVAWTAAEREAFGINDTERWIRETDRELATGSREAPAPILQAGSITAETITTDVMSWGSISPIRQDSIVTVRDPDSGAILGEVAPRQGSEDWAAVKTLADGSKVWSQK